MTRHMKELLLDMSAQKESVIQNAVSHHIGHDDWCISDINHRANIIPVSDGSEIFTVDGVQLVRFFPTITNIDRNIPGIHLIWTQQYRLLY